MSLPQHLWFYNGTCAPSCKVPDVELGCLPPPHLYDGKFYLCDLHFPPSLFFHVPHNLHWHLLPGTTSAGLCSVFNAKTLALYKEMYALGWRNLFGEAEGEHCLQLLLICCSPSISLWSQYSLILMWVRLLLKKPHYFLSLLLTDFKMHLHVFHQRNSMCLHGICWFYFAEVVGVHK